MLENYGFTLLSVEEAKTMQLPSGSGLFDELFHAMKDEIEHSLRKQEYGNALQMTIEEKKSPYESVLCIPQNASCECRKGVKDDAF